MTALNYIKKKSSVKTSKPRFLYLLLVLSLWVVVYPALYLYEESSLVNIILGRVVVSLVPLALLYAFDNFKSKKFLKIFFVVFSLLFIWTTSFFKNSLLDLSYSLFLISLYSYIIIFLLKYILSSDEITADTIYGSICVYLLIGILWAIIYILINYNFPNSFHMPLSQNKVFDPVYFSFVTLTTLGYGDIIPISNYARALSFLEAIIGTLYPAIIIARIIGVYISSKNKNSINA